jgi:hypothetical protein
MGTRSVSVELQAKVAGYVAGMKTAADETDKLNRELADVGNHQREFEKIEAQAVSLTAAIDETESATHDLVKVVDHAGTQLKETAVDARFLRGELVKTRDEVLALAAAFAATGDKADLTKYKRQTRYLSDLERLAGKLDTGAGDAVKVAENVGTSLGQKIGKQAGLSASQSFGDVFEGALANPYVLVGLLPAAVEVGAAVGGAMLTGIGLAGLGAGVAGQLNDPAVQAAGSEVGKHVAAGFATATSAFQAPLLDVLASARGEWDALAGGLHSTFDALAPELRTLGGGLVGFADKLVPGLEKAAVAAEPLVTTFSDWLPRAGDEFAGLLGTMADNADTLDDGLKLVLGTVSTIVDLLNYGAKAGSWLFKAAEWTTGSLDALEHFGEGSDGAAQSFDRFGQAVQASGPDFDTLAAQLNQTTNDANSLAMTMADDLFSSLLASDRATLGLAESQTRLSESLKTNGKSFDIHTKAGQQNTEALLNSVEANQRIYDTMIKAGFGADQAAAAYDANTTSLEKQLQKAHVAQSTIDQLIGTYAAVPDTVNTDIRATGLISAIDNLGALIAAANHIDGKQFGFTVTEKINVQGHPYTNNGADTFYHGYAMGGQLPHAAMGAYFPPTDPGIIIAEPQTHGEWMIPQAGISPQRAYALGSSAMAPYGLAVGRPAMQMGGGGPQTLQLAATFVLPSGEVTHRQLITYALNTGRQPAQLFPAVSR